MTHHHHWDWIKFSSKPILIKKGNHLFQQGQPVEHIYLLTKGRIRLVRHTPDGELVTMHQANAGEMIAEASLFAETYHCSAIADLSSEVQTANRDTTLSRIINTPEFSQAALSVFARQVRDSRSLLEIRNTRSAQDRTLSYLRSIAPPNGKIQLEISIHALAYKLGLAHETLYRVLRKLEDDDIIDRPERGQIYLKR